MLEISKIRIKVTWFFAFSKIKKYIYINFHITIFIRLKINFGNTNVALYVNSFTMQLKKLKIFLQYLNI